MHKGFSEEGQLVRIPNSYKDAQKSPQWGDWNNAIQKEMDSLRKHNVYKLVKMSSVPKEEKIIGSRFVVKQKVDGRFKARLVVQGYVQEAGVDYGRSYAPVCRIGSIRTVLAIACEHGWPVWQMYVMVAFLQAHIDKDVYVKPAPGHDPRDPKTGEVMVYKLERSLYGLAQSPVLWYDTIDGVLIVIGFSPTHSDPCVYVHGSGDTLIILTLYVDDILLTGKDPVLVDQKKRELKERFEMTYGRSDSHPWDGGQARLRPGDPRHHPDRLRREPPRTLRDAKRECHAHTGIRTRAIIRAAGGQTTWSARKQALPVHHGQPALSRTMHEVRPVLRGEPTHESMQQAGRGPHDSGQACPAIPSRNA